MKHLELKAITHLNIDAEMNAKTLKSYLSKSFKFRKIYV